MDYNTFMKQLNKIHYGTYLLIGDDVFLRKMIVDTAKKMLEPGMVDLNYTVLDNPSAKEFMEEWEALPAFSEFRLVTVKRFRFFNAGKNDKELEQVCNCLKRKNEGILLIFLQEDGIDRRKAGAKALLNLVTEVDCSKPNDYDAAKMAERFAQQQGSTMEQAASRRLVEMLGNDLMRLYNEVEKLASFCKEITAKDIETYVTPSIEGNVFRMMDYFEAGKMEKGLSMLTEMERNKEAAPQIIGAIAHRFRLILQAKEAYESGKRNVLAALGGGYAAKKAAEARNRYSREQLSSYLRELLKADFAIKTGRGKDYDELTKLIVRIYQGAGANGWKETKIIRH